MQQQELGIKQGGTYVWKKQKKNVFSVKNKKQKNNLWYFLRVLKEEKQKKENRLIPFTY